jgi:hypothetical protein
MSNELSPADIMAMNGNNNEMWNNPRSFFI